jgi:hypothetical protein
MHVGLFDLYIRLFSVEVIITTDELAGYCMGFQFQGAKATLGLRLGLVEGLAMGWVRAKLLGLGLPSALPLGFDLAKKSIRLKQFTPTNPQEPYSILPPLSSCIFTKQVTIDVGCYSSQRALCSAREHPYFLCLNPINNDR